MDTKLKNENIRKLKCLVFEAEVRIGSGGYQIPELNPSTSEKGTVHIGGSTPKIPVETVVKVSADLHNWKCVPHSE